MDIRPIENIVTTTASIGKKSGNESPVQLSTFNGETTVNCSKQGVGEMSTHFLFQLYLENVL